MKMDKKGESEAQIIVSFALFVFIMILLINAGVLSAVLNAFNDPAFGGYGPLLGVLFVLLIIIGLLERFLGR